MFFFFFFSFSEELCIYVPSERMTIYSNITHAFIWYHIHSVLMASNSSSSSSSSSTINPIKTD